jgi:EmrB/QacA subfamily drug resistance transporter
MTVTAPLGCDIGLASSARKVPTAASPGAALATSILASSLAFVDGSVVNVGLPAIGHSLGAGAAELQWIINAYLLPLSALLLLGGALGDRRGAGRVLAFGVALFAASSAACAAAPSLAWLLAARALQGVGAALVLPNSLAVLGAAFEGEARGRAVGIWASASAVSSAIGPVLGGWLIDLSGWRTVFLINLPLAAAAIGFARKGPRDAPRAGPAPPLDVAGAVLGAGALGGLAAALTIGSGRAGWTGSTIALLLGGVILSVAFIRVEIRQGDNAMTPPRLFGDRRLIGLNLMTFLLYGALGGFLVLLPYLLITAAGYRATTAGAALLPFPVVMGLGGPILGALSGRVGARPLLTIGSLLAGAGFAMALRIDARGDYLGDVLPCVLLVALGMACAAAPLTTAVLSAVDDRHAGAASGLNSAVARAGGLAATALLGSVLAANGEALVAAVHRAAVAAAVAAAAAAAIVSWGLRAPPE